MCDDIILSNGNDCSSSYCNNCIPLIFEFDIEDCSYLGEFEVVVRIPSYWTNIIIASKGNVEINGDINANIDFDDSDLYSSYSLTVPSGSELDFTVTVVDSNLNLLGNGIHFFEYYNCMFLPTYSNDSCDFNVVYQQFNENEKNGYILKLEMENGSPPYSVFDIDNEGYYEYDYKDEELYIGIIPDTIGLNLLISDKYSCTHSLNIPPLIFQGNNNVVSRFQNINAWKYSNNIKIENLEKADFEVELYNINGNLFYSQKNNRLNELNINTSDFQEGVIIMRLKNENYHVTYKFMNF